MVSPNWRSRIIEKDDTTLGIPVVLALLDGMVNDLGYHGFFSGNVDLTAWDSIRSLQQWIESTEIDPFQAA